MHYYDEYNIQYAQYTHTHICLLQRQKNLAITFLQHSSSLPPSPDGKESFLEKISHLVITKHDFSLEHSLTISYPVLCPRVLLGPAGQVGEEHQNTDDTCLVQGPQQRDTIPTAQSCSPWGGLGPESTHGCQSIGSPEPIKLQLLIPGSHPWRLIQYLGCRYKTSYAQRNLECVSQSLTP